MSGVFISLLLISRGIIDILVPDRQKKDMREKNRKWYSDFWGVRFVD